MFFSDKSIQRKAGLEGMKDAEALPPWTIATSQAPEIKAWTTVSRFNMKVKVDYINTTPFIHYTNKKILLQDKKMIIFFL